jgi:hypothetical protein
MGQWYRIFGRSEATPDPAAFLEELRRLAPVTGTVDAEGGDWFRVELSLHGGGALDLERFLADEEGIRAELNSWAAYLEASDTPHSLALMERVIQSRQLVTLRRPADHADEALVERLCVATCRWLAAATDGFYQADDQGFFEADGTLLVREGEGSPK